MEIINLYKKKKEKKEEPYAFFFFLMGKPLTLSSFVSPKM